MVFVHDLEIIYGGYFRNICCMEVTIRSPNFFSMSTNLRQAGMWHNHGSGILSHSFWISLRDPVFGRMSQNHRLDEKNNPSPASLCTHAQMNTTKKRWIFKRNIAYLKITFPFDTMYSSVWRQEILRNRTIFWPKQFSRNSAGTRTWYAGTYLICQMLFFKYLNQVKSFLPQNCCAITRHYGLVIRAIWAYFIHCASSTKISKIGLFSRVGFQAKIENFKVDQITSEKSQNILNWPSWTTFVKAPCWFFASLGRYCHSYI